MQAAGDLLARVDANSTNHGRGLRGGTFRLKRRGGADIGARRHRCKPEIRRLWAEALRLGRSGRQLARPPVVSSASAEQGAALQPQRGQPPLQGSAAATARIVDLRQTKNYGLIRICSPKVAMKQATSKMSENPRKMSALSNRGDRYVPVI